MAEAINTLPGEIWKPVVGWEGLYEVSSFGRVYCLPRVVNSAFGAKARKSGKLMSCRPNRQTGYNEAALSAPGRKRRTSAHVLVCEAFIGPRPSDDHQVAHWDGVRTNNHVDNLRWATRKENAQDRNRHGTAPIGENAPNGKLTEAEVLAIRSEYRPIYGILKRIANKYNITSTQVLHIVHRRQWTHI